MRLTTVLFLGILGLLGWIFLRFPLEARRAEERDLSRYQLLSLPADLPPHWQKELAEAVARAPRVQALSPAASLAARNVFAGLAWVDPTTLQVETALPLGFAVRFRIRQPVLQVARVGASSGSWSLVSAAGIVLPEGHSLAHSASLPRLITPVPLPVGGRAAADPLLQEALALLPEYHEVVRITGLPLVALERMPGYPADAPGVPPAMAFVLANGTRIFWGRATEEGDPRDPGMRPKILRLQSLLQENPGLTDLNWVRLDGVAR